MVFILALAPLVAKTIELDAATIADITAAFDAGTLTAEKLVQRCLARIQAYDRQGPALHAVITLNPKALETARALDAERKAKAPRSPLHGIPIVLKDNYNTFDLPTTGGSVLLEGSIPPDANSERLTLARTMAPAARSFLTRKASSGGMEPSSSTEPPVVARSNVL